MFYRFLSKIFVKNLSGKPKKVSEFWSQKCVTTLILLERFSNS